MRAVMFNFTMGPSIDIISIITTAAIYVLGVSWMINGETGITVGVLVAFTAYIGRFWAPINTLAGFYNSLLTAISYLERIFETIDEPVVVKDGRMRLKCLLTTEMLPSTTLPSAMSLAFRS